MRAALGRGGPSALLLTHLPNVRWLCGFTGSAGSLLVLPRENFFFTDFRYRAQSAREVRTARRIECTGGSTEAIAGCVRRSRLKRLGFEAERLTVAAHTDLAAALPGVELVPLRGTVERLRAVKDSSETAIIRRAIAIAGRSLAFAARRLAGKSEKEVAELLRTSIHREGGDRESFPAIVASGPRSALPHAVPTERAIGGEDIVIIDFGAKINGYCSDVTRSYLPAKWDSDSREIYGIVLKAQRAAIDRIAPGVAASEVDAAAREVIEAAGYGEHFGHGTGHGVGLEVHELPSLSPKSGDKLESGMVVTVEPGIYLEKFGGVRIEDMVLVTNTGREVMSRRIPKFLDDSGRRRRGE